MRLLVATPLYPPETGGPATYAKILEDELPKHGVTVVLAKFSDVRHLPKLVRHIMYFFMLIRRARDADLVFALDPVSTGFPAALAARVTRKPFLLKVVGDYAWEQGRQRFGVSTSLDRFVHERQHSVPVRFLMRLEAWVAHQAAGVIVPSMYLKGIVRTWGVPEERTIVIPNAVPSSTPGVLPEGLPMKRPRVVSAGRLVPWKGMGGLIDAMVLVRARIPDATLIIAGDGPDRNDLEAYARARLHDGYTFTGKLMHDEVLALLGSADVFVLNSSYEGLSHLLIEGLQVGAPTVATDVGGNREVITHEENGLLIPEGDRDALPEAIMRVAQEEGLAERLHQAAKSSSTRFSTDSMISSLTSYLHTFL